MKIIEHQLNIPPDYQYKALKHGHPFQKQWHKNRLILSEILFNFKKNDYLCDVGCGSGNTIFAFYQRVKRCDGCDYNKNCLKFIKKKVASEKVNNVRLFNWDILKPPPKQIYGLYNKVIITEVIEHFDQSGVKKVLKNLKKILRRDGELLITTPNCGFGPWLMFEFFIDKFNLFPKLWGEQHKIRLTKSSLITLVKDSGIKIIKVGTFSLLSPFAIIFGSIFADWLAKKEIEHLKYLGPQLFIFLRK